MAKPDFQATHKVPGLQYCLLTEILAWSQSHPGHQVEMDRIRQYVKEEETRAKASREHKPSLISTFFEYLLGLKIVQNL